MVDLLAHGLFADRWVWAARPGGRSPSARAVPQRS
jgi:hypothetical protein